MQAGKLRGGLSQTTEMLHRSGGFKESIFSPLWPVTAKLVYDEQCDLNTGMMCRIKSYILKRRLMPKLMKPIQCREKWLVIAAIRFLRTCISMKDEFYHRCVKPHGIARS